MPTRCTASTTSGPTCCARGRSKLGRPSAPTTILLQRFRYCFEAEGNGFYNPIYRHHQIDGPFTAAGVPVVPFTQDHGTTTSLGFRFGPVAYANDVVTLSEEAFEVMAGVEVLIVDAMRFRPHPTHAHLDRALRMDRTLAAKAGFFDQSSRRYGLC